MARCPACHRRLTRGSVCPADRELAGLDEPAPVPAAPPELPGHVVEGSLGAGGFATVFLAHRRADARPLAVKVAHRADDETRRRFAREAGALAAIGPPVVPALHASGVLDDGKPFIAMERLHGATLADLLAEQPGPPPLAWIRGTAERLLAAVAAVHGHGIVHRDLKPENIVLAADSPRCCLIDFGLVRGRDHAQVTETDTVVGTAEYLAPEQLDAGAPADARADLYALGVILFELFALRPPFVGERARVEYGHRMLQPPRLHDLADCPPRCAAVIARCLAKQPGERPATIDELRDELARGWDEPVVPRRASDGSIAAAAGSPGERGGTRTDTGTARSSADGSPGAPRRASADPTAARARSVVVLCADEVHDFGRLAREVQPGVIVKRRGARAFVVFRGRDSASPIDDAVEAAARSCGSSCARAAIHVAPLILVEAGPVVVAAKGDALDDPARWLPEAPWDGVVVTAPFAELLSPERYRRDATSSGHYRVAQTSWDEPDSWPLAGRDELLAWAAASMREAFERRAPRLVELVGAIGTGKTRLASELGRLGARVAPGATIVLLAGRGAGGREALREAIELGAGAGEAPREQAEPTRPALAGRLLGLARQRPLVMILDDAHDADDLTVAVLEQLARADHAAPIWIAMLATPQLRARPAGGAGHEVIAVGELAPDAAHQLIAALLRPVEHPPAAVVARLAAWTGGNPQQIVELARALRRDGIVRRFPGSDVWYVATDELDRLPPRLSEDWFAEHELRALPGDLRALLGVCAVLGVDLARGEVEAVQAVLPEPRVDAATGLHELTRHGILRRVAGDRYRFARPALQQAIYRGLPDDHRALLHREGWQHWATLLGLGHDGSADAAHASDDSFGHAARDRSASHAHGVLDDAARYRAAYHAAGCGELAAAAALQLALGEAALARQDHREAEALFTAVIGQPAATSDPERAHALTPAIGQPSAANDRERAHALTPTIGQPSAASDRRLAHTHLRRAVARRKLMLYEEARQDACDAQQLGRGDPELLLGALLEEVEICDHIGQVDAAAAVLARAEPLVAAASPRLQARHRSWLGVQRMREQRFAESAQLLAQAIAEADLLGDQDTAIGASLLLGNVRLRLGDLDGGARALDDAVARCERAEDPFHLSLALCNRIELWNARHLPERGLDDLHRAIAIARDLGFDYVEGKAQLGLGELLCWQGRLDEAVEATGRAYEIFRRRFRERMTVGGWHGQYLAHAGRLDEARAIWEECRSATVDMPSHQIMLHSIDLATRPATAAEWDALVTRAERDAVGEELVVLRWLRARSHQRQGEREEARAAFTLALTDASRCGSGMAGAIAADLGIFDREGAVIG